MAEFEVNPWDVKGVVNYEKLVKDFGINRLNAVSYTHLTLPTIYSV